MTIEHNTITDPNIHEPKGVSSAAAGRVYIADGLGSGDWDFPNPKGANTATAGQVPHATGAGELSWKYNPFGFVYFENISSPYTLSYPSTYTKINAVTSQPGVSVLVTEGTNSRLTYLGEAAVMDVTCNVSLDQASGSDRDLQFVVFKNGVAVPGSSCIITSQSGAKRCLSISAAATFQTNDYVEVYAKNNGANGDIRVYTFALFLDPH